MKTILLFSKYASLLFILIGLILVGIGIYHYKFSDLVFKDENDLQQTDQINHYIGMGYYLKGFIISGIGFLGRLTLANRGK